MRKREEHTQTFLSTHKFLPQITASFLTETRTYDAVKHGWDEAAEDEIALAKLTGMSPYIAFMFPDQAAKYERYIDMLEITQEDRTRWESSFRYFLKKIMLQTGKRVVVKSVDPLTESWKKRESWRSRVSRS